MLHYLKVPADSIAKLQEMWQAHLRQIGQPTAGTSAVDSQEGQLVALEGKHYRKEAPFRQRNRKLIALKAAIGR